jgi:hypothetical protein
MSIIPLYVQRRFEERWASRSFSRLRQTCQKMPERKPRHQRGAARGKDQRKTRQGEAMTKTSGEVEPFKPIPCARLQAAKQSEPT